MRHIRICVYAFIILSALGIIACVFILSLEITPSEISAYLLFAVLLLIAGIAVTLWASEFKRLKIMKLITENPIMHIRTAVISDETAPLRQPESTEVVISYFGILLAERIIKFNQDGIRLRGVGIGNDFISFTYGTEKQTQNIRLLRPVIDPAAMEEICERFRYETGIKPHYYLNERE